MDIRIALAGNPNSGKTTLFNALTGSNQFVGNWPGVTVEKKEGRLRRYTGVIVTDLPGIYSLSPYTLEEVVARNYLIGERPDAILNIVDGTNLERNLYLTMQLSELGIPMVVAINMMDAVERNGDKIRKEELEKVLGCRVVEISALKGKGLTEAAEAAVEAARTGKAPAPQRFSGPVESALARIAKAVPERVPAEQRRWYAVKLFERDEKVLAEAKIPADARAQIGQEIAAVEKEQDDDAESIITNERYSYITVWIRQCYRKGKNSGMTVSDRIDRVVTNRYAALPIFALIMFLVYYLAVSTVGTWMTDWTNDGLFGDGYHLFGIGDGAYTEAADEYAADTLFTDALYAQLRAAEAAGVTGASALRAAAESGRYADFAAAMDSYADALTAAGYDLSLTQAQMEEAPSPEAYGIWVPGIPVWIGEGLEAIRCADWLSSLILDGIVAGVGAVLGFLPQMLVLFLLLAFLEACGYMARIAFVMDRIFRKFGLSGKSFIPMLIGTGCGVPGIMASRTIENERDRRMTIMTTTFIPCGAKLPIIALISSALFGGAWWVAPSAYFAGVAAIVISGILLKKTRMFSGDPAPFVMELPAYHWPTAGNLLRSVWERGSSFLRKAGTVILLASVVVWAGSVFGIKDGAPVFHTELELEHSFLGLLGTALAPVFAPLGFGSIKATVATFMGLVAKEEVVGVFGVLDFEGMTRLSAYSFLLFNLLCAPCFAAIGAIRREMNSARWTWFAIGYQCGFAYAVSLTVYQLGMLFSGSANAWGVLAALVVMGYGMYMLFRSPERLPSDGRQARIGQKEGGTAKNA